RCKNWYRGAFNARVYASRLVSCFLQQTCPIHYFTSKTHVLDGFVPFCCPTRPIGKNCIRGHLMHEFVLRKSFFLLGRNEHAQSTTLGQKLIFTIFLDTSMHFYKAFDDT